jgi:hypothetical protein
MQIENSTLNEKIEDRNEELAKLRKKTTGAIQVCWLTSTLPLTLILKLAVYRC